MNKVRKIAVTGGPCGGKSEVMEALKEIFGQSATIMPEVATQLLEIPYGEGGVGIPGKDLEWSQDWQDNFQQMVIDKQLEDETILTQIASLRETDVILICDRGVLDGAAYLEGGRHEFLEKFSLSEEQCFGLYDAVIHLNSLATDNPELYERLKATNPSRFEDAETAQELDHKLHRAWEGHPRHIRIPAQRDISSKIELCQSIIENFGITRPETGTDIPNSYSEIDIETKLNQI